METFNYQLHTTDQERYDIIINKIPIDLNCKFHPSFHPNSKFQIHHAVFLQKVFFSLIITISFGYGEWHVKS